MFAPERSVVRSSPTRRAGRHRRENRRTACSAQVGLVVPNIPCGSGQRKGLDCEPWRASEALIIGQQVGAEVLGEGDVEPVGDGDGVPETPSIREQAANLHRHQRPGQKFGDRGRYLIDGKDVVELPPAKYSPAFGEEWSGTQGTASAGRSPRKARPRTVSAASSTPAEASMTTGLTLRRGREAQPRCRRHEPPERLARRPGGGPARRGRSQPSRHHRGWSRRRPDRWRSRQRCEPYLPS